MNRRSNELAARLEAGAAALAELARTMTDTEWQMRMPKDGRKMGVIVHHVASVYPIEVQLAELLGNGQAITGVNAQVIDDMNRDHAIKHDGVTKEAAMQLLATNSAAAATAIRALTDAQLDRAATNSMYGDAPLTCQHMLEDHAVRHSYHHLALMKAALGRYQHKDAA